MARASFALAVFAVATVALAAALWLLKSLRLPGRSAVSLIYSRTICAVLGLRIHVRGALARERPLMVVANHASWLDILVLTAVAPVVFVAKREVARWPLVGLVARLRPTVFVDRERRHKTSAVNGEIARLLAEGDSVVLFAEGTSSDGNRVLPFRSALIGAANALIENGQGNVALQPVSIGYAAINGLPLGRQHRPLVAWYGETNLLPHLVRLLRSGAVDVAISFGEPLRYDGADRKAAGRLLERTVRRLTSEAVRGQSVRKVV
jgi:1-acyl-sn-glycerol-3-phosphate acyltransferase